MKKTEIKESPVGTIYDNKEKKIINKILFSGKPLTRGKEIDIFERKFSEYCGSKYAVAVSSCGAALRISSQVINLKENDEVICQSNAFWVTINHLIEKKVKIICADIDPDSLNISINSLEKLITKKTKAIYIVHFGGNPANLDAIKKLIKGTEIILVEDAAHASGSSYNGKRIGYNSHITCFSFSTLKNISTLGEGGMFVTNNKNFYEEAKLLRTNFPIGDKILSSKNRSKDRPFEKKNLYLRVGDAYKYKWSKLRNVGTTYRMTTIQAAVGIIQLKKLDRLVKLRENIAKQYNKIIDSVPQLKKIEVLKNCRNSWHLYNFFLKKFDKNKRDKFIEVLVKKFKIDVIIRYQPINLNGVMQMNGCRNSGCDKCVSLFNVKQSWEGRQISLPISPMIKKKEIKYINYAIKTASRIIFKNN